VNWEERFKEFKNEKSKDLLYEEKYGPVVGPWLLEFKEKDKFHLQAFRRAKERYEGLQEFFRAFTDDVPQTIQEDFIKGLNFNKNYILENLQSHDWKKMWSQIQTYFGKEIVGRMESLGGEGGLKCVQWYPKITQKELIRAFWRDIKDENSKDGKALRTILRFYGYFISQIEQYSYILLEPEWPDSASDFVFRECKEGTIYCIIPRCNVDLILERGFKCSNGNKIEWKEDFKNRTGRYPTKEETNSNFIPYRFFSKKDLLLCFSFY